MKPGSTEYRYSMELNPFSHKAMLQQTTLKTFRNDYISLLINVQLLNRIKNIEANEEIAHYAATDGFQNI